MNTQIIYTILAWEKELEIQQQASTRRRYYFGVEESAIQPCKENRKRLFDWRRSQPTCECP